MYPPLLHRADELHHYDVQYRYSMTLEEAEAAVQDMLAGNAFGDAGHRIVIEEFLHPRRRVR